MDRIICIDKPNGFTSFDVVAKMRGILKTKKIGHGGTLDPMATGVLPVFVGKATRLCDTMPADGKEYIADIKFGIKTDTLDITGEVLKSENTAFEKSDLERVLPQFLGDIKQVPPMYSAIKIGGKKLYELARQGIDLADRPARDVTIKEIEILDFDEANQTAKIRVACSKGTYIRSLCDDIGTAMGSFAALSGLIRSKSGIFTLDNAITLEQLEEFVKSGKNFGFPIDKGFEVYESITLAEKPFEKLLNGIKIPMEKPDGNYRVYGCDGEFGGVITISENKTESFKNFADMVNRKKVDIKRTGVALGFFDGIHTGHLDVINSAVKDYKNSSAVLTFTLDSENLGRRAKTLLTDTEKEQICTEIGVGRYYAPKFSSIKDMTGEEFFEKILIEKLSAKALYCGENFKFGKGASCDTKSLKTFCDKHGIELNIVKLATDHHKTISSTFIKELLQEGDTEMASVLMQRDFTISGTVIDGNHLGRTIGIPTANILYPEDKTEVKYGVYAVKVEIEGNTYSGITNIGVKPTVGSEKILAETFIFDFDKDIYGKEIKLYLKKFLRAEKKFDSIENLKKQVENDINNAKIYLQ